MLFADYSQVAMSSIVSVLELGLELAQFRRLRPSEEVFEDARPGGDGAALLGRLLHPEPGHRSPAHS